MVSIFTAEYDCAATSFILFVLCLQPLQRSCQVIDIMMAVSVKSLLLILKGTAMNDFT